MSDNSAGLPPGWAWTEFGALAERRGGGTPSRSVKRYFQGNTPWITVADLPSIGTAPPTIAISREAITDEAIAASSAKPIPKGSIVFATRVSVGKVGIAGCTLATNQDFRSLLPGPAHEPFYIAWFLSYIAQFNLPENQGTTIKGITASKFDGIQVPLPPLAEQRRIVAKIEVLQERSRRAREALSEVAPLLDQFRQSVLAAAFRGDLTADWRADHPNVEPVSKLLHRIRAERSRCWEQAELAKYAAKGQKPPKNWQDKYEEPEPVDDSDLPELPEGWAWASVAEITANHDNIRIPLKLTDREKRQGSFPYYGAFGIIDYIDGYLFDGEYVLIAEDGKNLLQRTRPISLIASGRFWVNNHAHILTTFCQMPLGYIECFFNSPVLNLDQYLTGIDQVKLTQGALNTIPVPVAPLPEQQEITQLCKETIEMVDRQLKAVAIMRDEAGHLDQSILAKAFRGELVPQDSSDEPASVFLECIRAQRKQQAEARKQASKTPQRSNMGKKLSRLGPQQLTLPEVLTTRD